MSAKTITKKQLVNALSRAPKLIESEIYGNIEERETDERGTRYKEAGFVTVTLSRGLSYFFPYLIEKHGSDPIACKVTSNPHRWDDFVLSHGVLDDNGDQVSTEDIEEMLKIYTVGVDWRSVVMEHSELNTKVEP